MFQQSLKDDKKHSVATAISNLVQLIGQCWWNWGQLQKLVSKSWEKRKKKKAKETEIEKEKKKEKVYRGQYSISGKVSLLFRGEKKKWLLQRDLSFACKRWYQVKGLSCWEICCGCKGQANGVETFSCLLLSATECWNLILDTEPLGGSGVPAPFVSNSSGWEISI